MLIVGFNKLQITLVTSVQKLACLDWEKSGKLLRWSLNEKCEVIQLWRPWRDLLRYFEMEMENEEIKKNNIADQFKRSAVFFIG